MVGDQLVVADHGEANDRYWDLAAMAQCRESGRTIIEIAKPSDERTSLKQDLQKPHLANDIAGHKQTSANECASGGTAARLAASSSLRTRCVVLLDGEPITLAIAVSEPFSLPPAPRMRSIHIVRLNRTRRPFFLSVDSASTSVSADNCCAPVARVGTGSGFAGTPERTLTKMSDDPLQISKNRTVAAVIQSEICSGVRKSPTAAA